MHRIIAMLAALTIAAPAMAGTCSTQKNAAVIIANLNNDLAHAHWPLRTTAQGFPVVDLDGEVQDYSVLADAPALGNLPGYCILNLKRDGVEQTIRYTYWANIAGQLLHQVSTAPRDLQYYRCGINPAGNSSCRYE